MSVLVLVSDHSVGGVFVADIVALAPLLGALDKVHEQRQHCMRIDDLLSLPHK